MMMPLRIGSVSLIAACALVSEAHAGALRVTLEPAEVALGESVQLRIEAELPLSTQTLDPTFDAPDFVRAGATSKGSAMQYSGSAATARKQVYWIYLLTPRKQGKVEIRNIQMRTNVETYEGSEQSVVVQPPRRGGGAGQGQAPAQRPGAQPSRRRPQFPGLPPGFAQNFPQLFGDEEDDPFQQLFKNFQQMQRDEEEDAAGGGGAQADEDESTNPAAPGYVPGSGGGSSGAPAGAAKIGALDSRDHPERFNSDFTVHASLSKQRAYVGEPIVVEYSLWDFGGLRQVEVQKWPVFTGFWKEDLEIATRFDFEQVFVNGELNRRAFLGRYAIYGIKPGKFNLDKLAIRGRYVDAGNGGFGINMRSGSHSSQDVTLEILPLPKEGQPARYTGAVGKFGIKLDADKTTVAQNTPVTFTVQVSGAGNFQSIESIPVPLPPDFELYESNTGSRGVVPLGVRRELETSKTFTYTAIPRKAGKFTVEPIAWNYFDPETGKYVELKTAPVELNVVESAAGGAQGTNTYLPSGGGGPGGGAGPRSEIRDLKPVGAAEAAPWRVLPWAKLVIGLLAVWNIYLLYRLLETRAGRLLGRFLEDRFEAAKQEWGAAKISKGGDWVGHLESSMLAGMEVLLGVNPRGLPRAEIEGLWREKGLPLPLFEKISKLLDRLDQVRFSSRGGAGEGAVQAGLVSEGGGLLGEMGKAGKKA